MKNFMQKINKYMLMLLAISGLCAMQLSHASKTVDALSSCLVESTTAADKKVVLQWTFLALAQHPDLKDLTQVNIEQKNLLDQQFAHTLQRILVEQCSTQAKAVIQADGIAAVAESFQELGQATGEELLKTPEIKQQLKGVLRYIDLNKLVMQFLAPDLWNKLGVIR